MITLAGANLKEAARSLLAGRQRTVLALIGIVVGAGSVIAMMSVGIIVRDESLRQFRELGTDILGVSLSHDAGAGAAVTVADALGLASLSTIARAAPYVISFGQAFLAGAAIPDVSVIGATAALADLNKLEIAAGRHLSDLDHRRYFCVIGSEVAAVAGSAAGGRLVGGSVTVDGAVYTVVGVLRRTPRGLRRFDANRAVIIPISTAQRVFAWPDIGDITARMSEGAHHVAAEREIRDYFRRGADGPVVRVESAEELIERMYEQMRLFALLLGSVGSISLFVGGIGVMNVMLVSVTERRVEIGVRRALGARCADIQSQFLIESVMLSTAGGLIGIGVGIAATWGICEFTGWAFRVSMQAMGLGVGVASATGVLFGFSPAYQAARLDPVEALRGR